MSRTRPPTIRRWSQLDCSTLLLTNPVRPSFLPAIEDPSPRNNRNSHSRPFHTTPSRSRAAPSPSTRRKAAGSNARPNVKAAFPGYQLLDASPNSPVNAALNARLQFVQVNGLKLASEMLLDGVIDKSITPRKFKRIGAALLKKATAMSPSKDAIVGIAKDEGVPVDTLYDIGREVFRGDSQLNSWLQESCMLAGVQMASLLTAARQLRMAHGNKNVYDAENIREPQLTPSIARVQSLATQSKSDADGQDNRDPRAMLLYAKFLGLTGQYRQGIDLVHDVLRIIEPTQIPPTINESLTLNGVIEPPWELYLWLLREDKKVRVSPAAVNETNSPYDKDGLMTVRLGAMDYQDPIAMMRFAEHFKALRKMQSYEKLMGRAASAGNKDACRKLANYYYLISVGLESRPGERRQTTKSPKRKDFGIIEAKQPKGFFATLLSYFAPRSCREYRLMAIEWYRVAWAENCVRSGLHLACLLSQEGDKETAETILHKILELPFEDGITSLRNMAQRCLDRTIVGGLDGLKVSWLDT
ncbi:uncharacterized protein DSM5745_04561 [Aspergillus mulundensis]|uniref:Uncharacterized protein n=1 Tax=Aspergillus mulundensis TaxID=1810919 RepID=A0A3D8S4M1_9EURO|nr:hypothetical protein DSM5745_04561 [Aspergillus mulundensis]RDW81004.1 hypothetical protein DSM5745_04561 [Aspergillus mulundensis]